MGPAGDEGHDARDDDADDDALGPDDGHDDQLPLGAPPDRMDRLWVHPAELSPVAPPQKRSRTSALLVPLAIGALGALAAVVVLGLVGAFDGDSDQPPATQIEEEVARGDAALTQLARAVAPGLVLVTVKDASGSRQSSGVCITHDGDVLTSTTTIGEATSAEVTTPTGEVVTAAVAGRDDASGLVLLDAEKPLRAVPVSDGPTRAGDSVWIFGANPPGQTSPWISGGVVSAVDAVVAEGRSPMTAGLLESDALVTTWASGGALVDRSGAVSGIVLAPVGARRSAYAVPIARAVAIADELRETGWVAHAAMPVEATDTSGGPQVTAVPPDGPAARAGVLPGDVVVSVDRRDVLDVGELTATVHGYGPGKTVELKVLRNGVPVKVEVTLASTTPSTPAP